MLCCASYVQVQMESDVILIVDFHGILSLTIIGIKILY